MLVVILEEVEHAVAYAFGYVPAMGDECCRSKSAGDASHRVVEIYFIVEIVEMTIEEILTIDVAIVDFGDENHIGVLFFYLRNHPIPELHGHHKSHVASEAVDALFYPILYDMEHFLPSVGDGREVPSVVGIVDAVV